MLVVGEEAYRELRDDKLKWYLDSPSSVYSPSLTQKLPLIASPLLYRIPFCPHFSLHILFDFLDLHP